MLGLGLGFYGEKILYNLDLCEGALVCLEGVNINPNAGLYVGSIGRVVEIVYDEQHTVGPNGDKTKMSHLPSYIVVDFPNFKPPQGLSVWDEENPTVSEHIILCWKFPILQFLTNSCQTSLILLHPAVFQACPNQTTGTKMQQTLLLCNIHATPNCLCSNHTPLPRSRSWS